jgi:Na+-transporting methylmalonyl-CoA/oxaloacetate decarboxylase gamma subunit
VLTAFFAWLLGFAIRNWHAALFAAVVVIWAIALRFRGITLVEVAFAALILLSYVQDYVGKLIGRIVGEITLREPEDE